MNINTKFFPHLNNYFLEIQKVLPPQIQNHCTQFSPLFFSGGESSFFLNNLTIIINQMQKRFKFQRPNILNLKNNQSSNLFKLSCFAKNEMELLIQNNFCLSRFFKTIFKLWILKFKPVELKICFADKLHQKNSKNFKNHTQNLFLTKTNRITFFAKNNYSILTNKVWQLNSSKMKIKNINLFKWNQFNLLFFHPTNLLKGFGTKNKFSFEKKVGGFGPGNSTNFYLQKRKNN
eukprot:TRINITY_DN64332_c0_g1_i1.p1 TRINITY_DN64332_c0_g1~~TRINITY_DN64332_c0_g1_i1.p1  ORF type:complete len:233 (-),score=6.64 TRINITY_DN64332_c0_g1_i1:92-790(-)